MKVAFFVCQIWLVWRSGDMMLGTRWDFDDDCVEVMPLCRWPPRENHCDIIQERYNALWVLNWVSIRLRSHNPKAGLWTMIFVREIHSRFWIASWVAPKMQGGLCCQFPSGMLCYALLSFFVLHVTLPTGVKDRWFFLNSTWNIVTLTRKVVLRIWTMFKKGRSWYWNGLFVEIFCRSLSRSLSPISPVRDLFVVCWLNR